MVLVILYMGSGRTIAQTVDFGVLPRLAMLIIRGVFVMRIDHQHQVIKK